MAVRRVGEILWYHTETREIQTWSVEGHQCISRATVVDDQGNPTHIGPPFSIVGIVRADDILWHNSETGEIQIWQMEGHKLTGRATVVDDQGNPTHIGPPFSIVGTPNLENILWHNSETGEIQIWFMNGHKRTGRATVVDEQGNPAPIGPPFSIVGTGDFQPFGSDDILWHNSETGEIQIWFMNGHKRTGRATVVDERGNPIPIGPPFSIVGVGNFDGVFKDDILWHNSETGEIQIWFMFRHRIDHRETVVDKDGNPALIGPPFSIVAVGETIAGEPDEGPIIR